MSRERAELSKKNPYHIPRYRYYELKYFCRQYEKSWRFLFLTRKIQPPLWKEMNKFRRYFTMLKNVIKGFEEMMNCVLTAMNESLSDPYAGWNEGEELLMLNEVRCGIR